MRWIKTIRLTVALLPGFWASWAAGQQPSYFVLGADEFQGMDIYSITQDVNHNYWIATDVGLFRYNYYEFQKIPQSQSNGSSLFGFTNRDNNPIYCHNLNNQIFKIEGDSCVLFYELTEEERSSDIHLLIDDDGNLLVIGRQIFRLNRNGEKSLFSELPEAYYGFPYLLKDGSVLLYCTSNQNLIRIVGDEVKTRMINLGETVNASGMPFFFYVGEDLFGVHSASCELYKVDPERLDLVPMKKSLLPEKHGFLRFYRSSRGLWIAANNRGVSYMSRESFDRVSTWFTDYKITHIYEDHEGNMLLGTDNHGILVIPDLSIPDVMDLPDKFEPTSVKQDPDFGTLIGTSIGWLLSVQDNSIQVLDSSGSDPLTHVFSWPDFPLIVFGDNGIRSLNRITGKVVNIDNRSLKDAVVIDGEELWMATNIGLIKAIVHPDGSIEKSSDGSVAVEYVTVVRCFALVYDNVHEVLYVSTSEGLKTVSRSGSIKPFLYAGKNVFANDLEFDGETIYVATRASGILMIHDGKVDDAYLPGFDSKILEVSQLKKFGDHFFAITSEGFIITDELGRIQVHLDYSAGYIPNRVFDFDVYDDQLWVAHSKGVQKLEINQLMSKPVKPELLLSSVSVNGHTVDPSRVAVFGSDDHKFLFTLSVPTLRNRESIRYHYWLEGYEQEQHINSYQENKIVYNALGSGEYTFHARAESRGYFGGEISYAFEIKPPVYFRWWFLTLGALVLIWLVYQLYRYQLKRQQIKADLLNQINVSRLAAIRSQMNPHFIFNSLNSIQDLVLKGDIDNSYKSITHFSDMIRRALNYSDKDFIDLDDEIGLIELYLGLEKLRFKSSLVIDMESFLAEDIEIPPMMIQPFIENALIHGLLHKEGERRLRIRFELHDTLRCIIEDNGIGMKKSAEIRQRQQKKYESFSGKAIHQRFKILTLQYGEKIGFEREDILVNGEVKGTRVVLDIPYRRKF